MQIELMVALSISSTSAGSSPSTRRSWRRRASSGSPVLAGSVGSSTSHTLTPVMMSGTVFINRGNNKSAIASMQQAGEDMKGKRVGERSGVC